MVDRLVLSQRRALRFPGRGVAGVIAMAMALASAAACRESPGPSPSAAAEVAVPRGTIKGRVRLDGRAPENKTIDMRGDPMCDQAHTGAPAIQEAFVVDPQGGLANVVVQLQGSFPSSAAPTDSVRIDQKGCLYHPRVVGVRVGQSLRVSNSDPGMHNVHGISVGSDGFNVAQPMPGMVNEFQLKQVGILRVMCDVHPWMIAFVAVVDHPYFSVSRVSGTFEIPDVPAGVQTLQAWHEQLGMLTATVHVEAGAVADVELTYPGRENPQ